MLTFSHLYSWNNNNVRRNLLPNNNVEARKICSNTLQYDNIMGLFPILDVFLFVFWFSIFFSYSRKYYVFRVENQTNVNKNTGEIAYKTLKPKHSTELSTRTKRESKYTKNIHNIIQIWNSLMLLLTVTRKINYMKEAAVAARHIS